MKQNFDESKENIIGLKFGWNIIDIYALACSNWPKSYFYVLPTFSPNYHTIFSEKWPIFKALASIS